MLKWTMFTLFVIASAMAIVFTVDKAMEPAENAEEAPAGENELRVQGENFHFDQETYTVKAGTQIRIEYKDKVGGGRHSFAIEGTDINLATGESVEHTFEPGTYKIYCNIMCGEGHAEMMSTLIVE